MTILYAVWSYRRSYKVLAVHCLISLHIKFINCRKFRYKYILYYVVIRVSGFAVNLKQ